jgi:hypothetical protein
LTDVSIDVSIPCDSTSCDSTRSSSLISEFIRLFAVSEPLVLPLLNVLIALTYVGVDDDANVSKLSYIVDVDDVLVVGRDGIASDNVEGGGGGGGICCVSSFKLTYEPCKL